MRRHTWESYGGFFVHEKGDLTTAHTCPKCGEVFVVLMEDSYRTWLNATLWQCPYCRETLSNSDLSRGRLKG